MDALINFMLGASSASLVYSILFWPTVPKSPDKANKKSR